MRLIGVGLGVAIGLAVATPAAEAHVVLEMREATPGSFYKAVLSGGHGCDGSPTVRIRAMLPEGFIAAKPMPKPGWEIQIEEGDYTRSYRMHGREMSRGAKEIVWSGGPLPDNYYDEFVIRGYLPGDLKAGEEKVFPVVQECEEGELRWEEVPEPGQEAQTLKRPATRLKLVPKEGDGHHHH
jgi:periplasmic copper chaperone A